MILQADTRLATDDRAKHRRFTRSAAVASLACLLAVGGGNALLPGSVVGAHAQGLPGLIEPDPDAQLFLEADQLIYEEATDRVRALGQVRLFYDGYTVDADEVVYDRANARVIAIGNVILVEPSGAVLRARSANLSDTLGDGFIDALEVETPENAFFTARTATRRDGAVTVFEDGTYTACPECEENPEKPRTWMLSADEITYDEAAQMVYYRNVQLDFLGIPIGWLPFFAHADPTVERKTGFLAPTFVWDADLGASASVPYYIALAPSYDITLTPTVYSEQGLHLQAEWRQRLANGQYAVRASGIYQLDRDAFAGQPGDTRWRGGIASEGEFQLNSRWTAGWNLYWQSDRRYFRDYGIESEDDDEVVSDIFLKGLHDRSYFDARVQRIEVTNIDAQDQPWTAPVIDYDRRFTPGFVGGELRVTANVTSTYRDSVFIDQVNLNGVPTSVYEGLDGQHQRASVDVSWRRQFIGPLGMVITPQAGFRGDAIAYDLTANATLAGFDNTDDAIFRAMPYGAIEWRWPFLVSSPGGSHIIEPIAQVIVRPDATDLGQVPNEDSQSLVFEAASLFDIDKYSGFDQVEGGTRANVGARYTGVFASGLALSAIVGQSFHLAGENPYATTTIVLNEADSGLETDVSDYVGMVSARMADDFSLTASGRFDKDDFSLERAEVIAAGAYDRLSASLAYAYLGEQTDRGINEGTHQITGTAAVQLDQNWRVAGSLRYDIENSDVLEMGAGLAYADECFDIALTYTHTSASANGGQSDNRLMLSLSLRTIGKAQTEVLDQDAFDNLLGTR
ncbi:MAG: LPS-assembly protein LptD [Devosiaceae bacterium]|nr:LPS-assembly protein LptD [Devosiaceae bacterium MH13]